MRARPCGKVIGAERDGPRRLRLGLRRQAIGAANQKRDSLLSPIAQLRQQAGKGLAGDASPVRSRQIRRWEEGILASSASASALLRRSAVAAFGFRYLDHAERRQMELSAGGFGAAEIMREQIALRPLLQLADGSDQEPHSCSPSAERPATLDQITSRSMGRSADHIFSRL